MKFQNITYSVPWNLFLITLGSILVAVGLKGIVIPHGLITGGFSGLGLLLYYYFDIFTPGIWYLVLNIPVFFAGWFFVSRRFILYSIFGTIVLTLSIDLIHITIPVQDLMLAAISGGFIVGAGAGITLRSLGSAGGNDIISIILNQNFSIRIGTYTFVFNFLLFVFSFSTLETDVILYSMAMSYITSQMIEYCLTLFNQRKMILIISEKSRDIADEIMSKLNRGVTLLNGQGGYTGKDKQVVLTVVNTFQIKRVEETAFMIDPNAFLITENTFNVLGRGFSQRKVY
jgi:uncharacterized membrane-anchored protein YitT (DUF2179 family)